ncbi:ferritin-like domain-containing protein [Pseudonocardia sp. RS010]|uniref:ferritin-like domain-containing protein n=1 Tax=Pseudonocardia sp. RS010 TaxID=3385979 RepID=UPI00399F90C1
MANAAVISQLRTLEQLTRTEVQIARTRVAQARTDAVRRELQQNGENAERRAERLAAALRDLGEVPDVVSPAVGFAAYLVKSTVEQAQPLDEALLGDLALEHQLLDRARYLVALTAEAGPVSVHGLAEQLVSAHSATVDWLTTVLAEEALGGPAALRPTALQAVAGGVTRAVALPTRITIGGVNRAAHRFVRAGDEVRARLGRIGDKVGRFASDTGEVVGTAVDAGLERAEDVAHADAGAEAGATVHAVRRDAGALRADELPIAGYETKGVQDAVAAIRQLRLPGEIQAVIRYEEQHKARSSVVSAAQTHYASIAKETVGVE